MVEIIQYLGIANNIWQSLKSQQSKKAAQDILGITEELTATIKNILHLTSEASEDVVEILLIAMSAASRLSDDMTARSISIKPIEQAENMDDIAILVAQQIRIVRGLDFK